MHWYCLSHNFILSELSAWIRVLDSSRWWVGSLNNSYSILVRLRTSWLHTAQLLIRWRCQTMLNSLHHKHLTLQKHWANVCWKGFHWPEVGHTMNCPVYMSWCKVVWNHLTHSPQVTWPVRMKTVFMRVGSSLPITLLYQFWWVCQSTWHPAPHKFRPHSCVNLVVVS